ncbi:hypothetical protein AOQ84DRAFT_405725 [Glonium stellatum]|uniref:Uncharacterized protein n=1 Tax=Glonium stellatum TaxID=574774 RepID=A0A8E2JTU5_9PEZI|nr:hypothetical protein AOQ84DRAFT_405725 [Glonium stellatum]
MAPDYPYSKGTISQIEHQILKREIWPDDLDWIRKNFLSAPAFPWGEIRDDPLSARLRHIYDKLSHLLGREALGPLTSAPQDKHPLQYRSPYHDPAEPESGNDEAETLKRLKSDPSFHTYSCLWNPNLNIPCNCRDPPAQTYDPNNICVTLEGTIWTSKLKEIKVNYLPTNNMGELVYQVEQLKSYARWIEKLICEGKAPTLTFHDFLDIQNAGYPRNVLHGGELRDYNIQENGMKEGQGVDQSIKRKGANCINANGKRARKDGKGLDLARESRDSQ